MGKRTPLRALAAGAVVALLGVGSLCRAGDAPAPSGREIPAPLAPFEYLIGRWRGSGVPAANRVRGWNETHAWAWAFEKGTPVGLNVTLDGGKSLAKGRLSFDAAAGTYTLNGTGVDRKPVSYTGTLDAAGKTLTLDRVGAASDGSRRRLTLFPNANFVRYTLRVSEKEADAPQFRPVIDVGLTKEGEAFASGGAAADLPRCVVTGGAATMTVSYQGASFPLCCTGCRDEFNDNPEKYIKKLALRKEAGGGAASKPAPAGKGKDDGSFDGLLDDAKPSAKTPRASGDRKGPPGEGVMPEKPKAGPANPATARAASLLRLGQNLEKAGKTESALGYYRQVVTTYPDTPAATTAARRIKVLSAK